MQIQHKGTRWSKGMSGKLLGQACPLSHGETKITKGRGAGG